MEKEEKREAALVKHSNHLAEIPLQNFSSKEIDLFWGMLYKIQNVVAPLKEIRNDEIIRARVSYNELRDVLGIQRRGNRKMTEDLKAMSSKFSQIVLINQDKMGEDFFIATPFIDFKGSEKKGEFTFGIHPEIAKLLNNLDGTEGRRYALSDVKSISRMKSTVSKECLKMLFLYRNRGYWYVTLDNLRYHLSIPNGYRTPDINSKILKVIYREFLESGLFEEFEITPVYDTKKAAGRKKILGYTFRFRFSPDAPISSAARSDLPTKVCPQCGELLVRKARKDGKGFFFGHPGGKDANARCRYTETIIESSASAEETGDEDASGESSVTAAQLDAYYRHIREVEIAAAEDRKEEIREGYAVIWELYEEKERRVSDFVRTIGTFGADDQARKEAKDAVDRAAGELESALEMVGCRKDHMDVRYRCSKCSDTGVTKEGLYCTCRKKRVQEAEEWLKKEEE